jgi:hypothetical protein
VSSDEALDVEPLTADRIARNQSAFREANDRLHRASADYSAGTDFPVICECADPACRALLRIRPEAYEKVRANSRWFLTLPGHHRAAQGLARVVAEGDGYAVAEKIGRAGEVAEELAKRAEPGE